MKNTLWIISLALCASPVWADNGDLVFLSSNGEWSNENTIPAHSVSDPIEVEAATGEAASITYRIEQDGRDGYDFTISIPPKGAQCFVNGFSIAHLGGTQDNPGPVLYTVFIPEPETPEDPDDPDDPLNYAQSAVNCNISVIASPNPNYDYPPMDLVMTHLDYLPMPANDALSSTTCSTAPYAEVVDVEPFTLLHQVSRDEYETHYYAAVTVFRYSNCLSYPNAENYVPGAVLIYEWDKDDEEFSLIQSITKNPKTNDAAEYIYTRPTATKVFRQGLHEEAGEGGQYLLIANYSNSDLNGSDSRVDVWVWDEDAEEFKPHVSGSGPNTGDLVTVPAFGAHDIEMICKMSGNTCDWSLLVVNRGSHLGYMANTEVRQWNEPYANFEPGPDGTPLPSYIPLMGPVNVESFAIDNTAYVAFANKNDEVSYETASTGASFVGSEGIGMPRTTTTHGIMDWEHFRVSSLDVERGNSSVKTTDYLIAANSQGFSSARVWTGDFGMHSNDVKIEGITDWQHVALEHPDVPTDMPEHSFTGYHYLFAAIPNSTGEIYYWCDRGRESAHPVCTAPLTEKDGSDGQLRFLRDVAPTSAREGGNTTYNTYGWRTMTVPVMQSGAEVALTLMFRFDKTMRVTGDGTSRFKPVEIYTLELEEN